MEVLRNLENVDLTVGQNFNKGISYWISVNKDHVPFQKYKI